MDGIKKFQRGRVEKRVFSKVTVFKGTLTSGRRFLMNLCSGKIGKRFLMNLCSEKLEKLF